MSDKAVELAKKINHLIDSVLTRLNIPFDGDNLADEGLGDDDLAALIRATMKPGVGEKVCFDEDDVYECSHCGCEQLGKPAVVIGAGRDSSDGLPTVLCWKCNHAEIMADPPAPELPCWPAWMQGPFEIRQLMSRPFARIVASNGEIVMDDLNKKKAAETLAWLNAAHQAQKGK